MRILFSIAVHESRFSVKSLINNLRKFTNNSIILIHISADFSEFDLVQEDFVDVYFNNVRMNTGYLDGSLLKAHVANMSYAERKNLSYDYFVPFGSNQMLIKNGIEHFIVENNIKKCKRLLPVSYVNILILFDWKNISFLRVKYKIKHFYKSSPEGTYWPRALVQENIDDLIEYCNGVVSKRITDYRLQKLQRVFFSFLGYVVYPLEELVLPTFMLRGGSKALGADYCYKDWENNLHVPAEKIHSISRRYLSVKRVDRSDNELRRYIDELEG